LGQVSGYVFAGFYVALHVPSTATTQIDLLQDPMEDPVVSQALAGGGSVMERAAMPLSGLTHSCSLELNWNSYHPPYCRWI